MEIFFGSIIFCLLFGFVIFVLAHFINRSGNRFESIIYSYQSIVRKVVNGKVQLKQGGIMSIFIVVMYITLIILSTLWILIGLSGEFNFLWRGLLIFVLTIIFILTVSSLIAEESASLKKKRSKKTQSKVVLTTNKTFKTFVKERAQFLYDKTMFFFGMSFFLSVSVLIVFITLLENKGVYVVGAFIGWIFLLSLFSNTMIFEYFYYREDLKKYFSNEASEICINQKRLIYYLILFVVTFYNWYHPLAYPDQKLSISSEYILTSMSVVFFLVSDRIFKLANDSYVKYKKEAK
ncbi:hypothetical protein [Exiguobacterium artemiae]|uniref:hypothetical protein n=1 Tax=Exiguobacterium artemiae TaxID=340145 RepID=UPI003CFD4A04